MRQFLYCLSLCGAMLYLLGGQAAGGQQQPVVKLCTPGFANFPKYPVHISNEIKACLDDVDAFMQRSPDARLVIVGHSKAGEPSKTAAQRAVNVRGYLVSEKGISPNRIVALYGGAVHDQSVTIYLVPARAVFTQEIGPIGVPPSMKPVFDEMDHEEGR